MKKYRFDGKNITSIVLSFAIFLCSVYSVSIHSFAYGGFNPYNYNVNDLGFDPMTLGFGAQPLVNGSGYWDDEQAGLRFSLVDKNGVSKKIVDVYDFETSVNVGEPNPGGNSGPDKSGGVIGTIGDIFSSKVRTSYGNYADDVEFRIFNRCKLDVVRSSRDECFSFSNHMILANTGDFDSYRSNDSCKWYCADFRNVFRNTDLSKYVFREADDNIGDTYLFKPYYNKRDPRTNDNPTIWWAYAKTDAVDDFICKHITGVERKTLYSFEPDDNAWIGMCDLLYSLGLNVYNGVSIGNWTDKKNISKLYNNLVKEFIIPEYSIIVEPIMFWGVSLFEEKIDAEGHSYYDRVRTSIYYGSMTELGILEANDWVCDEDRPYYTYKTLNINFAILHEAAVTRYVGQQCAYITDEYEYELKKCGGEGLLSVVSDEDFRRWDWRRTPQNAFNYGNYYSREDGVFTAYTEDIIRNYATAMSIIVPTDFIKPKVETYDKEYRTDTNVVTSLKVSNRSDTNYTTILDSTSITSNTAVNKNNVPKAMLCKFTVSKITDSSGEVGRWTADRSAITTQYQQKLEELGFAKEENGEYITEFYGSLDGIMPRDYSDVQPTCYVSVNWKTPQKPCKVTFEVEFQNANCAPEPVLGTAEHDGLRATEIKTDYGLYTTEFYCDIVEGENTTYFTEDTVPPDSVSIISVAPNAAEGTEEQKLYKLNHDIYDAYLAAYGTTPAVYTGTDFAGKTIVDSQSWSEYVASYDASNNIVLTHKPHTVSIGLTKTTDDTYTESTTKILRTDQSDLYSDYADTIGSGYGIGIDFISSYSNDEAGVDYIRDVTVNGVTYQNSLVTNYDHGVVMFPEYNYQTYYGELLQFDTDVDLGGRSAEKRFMFTANKDSKFYGDAVDRPAGMSDEEYAEYAEMNRDEKSRVHFTPVWYPDGKYQIVMCMFDSWTPAGELWFYKTYDIEIKGSIYDTWYITRTYKNQVAS